MYIAKENIINDEYSEPPDKYIIVTALNLQDAIKFYLVEHLSKHTDRTYGPSPWTFEVIKLEDFRYIRVPKHIYVKDNKVKSIDQIPKEFKF